MSRPIVGLLWSLVLLAIRNVSRLRKNTDVRSEPAPSSTQLGNNKCNTRGRGAKIFTVDGQFGFMEMCILAIRCFTLHVT